MPDAIPVSASVAVIGAGTMGSGIAHVAARAGHPVYLYDTAPGACERGMKAIRKDLDFLVGKNKLPREEADAIAARIRPTGDLHAMGDAALVVEAIVEDQQVKRDLYHALEAEVAADCIIATNTSSISITALAQGMSDPCRLVGMHFFNPAPRMALVEVIAGLATDNRAVQRVTATAKAWGKTPVLAKSTPGFIVNRVARPFYSEAMRFLSEQAASPATLDAVIRDCAGFVLGPCELMDLIGLDVNLAVTTSVFEAMAYDRRYAPSLLQQELVRAGRHGRKTGIGFYEYGEGVEKPAPAVEAPAPPPNAITVAGDTRLLQPLIERLRAAAIAVHVESGSGGIEPGTACLALSDGRTATRRAHEDGIYDLVLVDLCLDYARATRIGVARADECGDEAFKCAVGALQKAGMNVTRIDDIAGMAALRTVTMLINEAADVVTQGIASPADVDTAMRLGTAYPRGPLAWADELRPDFVSAVLDNLQAHYREERYRVSPRLNRLRLNGRNFHG